MLASVIREEARRLQFLLESTKLTEVDKEFFSLLLKEDMSDQSLRGSLRELSLLLCRHFDKRVIISSTNMTSLWRKQTREDTTTGWCCLSGICLRPR